MTDYSQFGYRSLMSNIDFDQLNPDQEAAFKIIRSRIRAREPVTEMTGPAGSGKSTLVSLLLAELNLSPFDADNPGDGGYIVCTPTNKAAAILRRKGVAGATTAHRVTSKPRAVNSEEVGTALDELQREMMIDPDSKAALEAKQRVRSLLKVQFDSGWIEKVRNADVIVVDEGGMLGWSVAQRLRAIGVPILAVGDPYQLPPVGEKADFLTGRPDIHLEMIERQAEDSPILRLSAMARAGKKIPPGTYGGKVLVQDGLPPMRVLRKSDQIIVGTHRTRRDINARFRMDKGLDVSSPPQAGEKYVSLRTVAAAGGGANFLNASNFVEMTDIRQRGKDWTARMRVPDDPDALVNLTSEFTAWGGPFADHVRVDKDRRINELAGLDWAGRHRRMIELNAMAEIDWAYAVTCHRMQGDEAEKITVLDDGWGRTEEDRRRWLYTALTRARDRLLLAYC